jgi:hypothetical protein
LVQQLLAIRGTVMAVLDHIAKTPAKKLSPGFRPDREDGPSSEHVD